MSKEFVRGTIKSMEDLAREKSRLKTHVAITQGHLVDELENLPGALIKSVLWKNAGTAAKVAGSLVLGKVLGPQANKLGLARSTAAKSTGIWGTLALNAGAFLAGEVVEFMKKRKERKRDKQDEGQHVDTSKKWSLGNLFKKKEKQLKD